MAYCSTYLRAASWLLSFAVLATPLPSRVSGQEDLEKRASWDVPQLADVYAQLAADLKTRTRDDLTQTKVAALWPPGEETVPPDQLLDRVAATFALVDADARDVVEFCRQTGADILPRKFPVLTDTSRPDFERLNLRLLYGRWLAQNRFYDEALQQLDGMQPGDVVDPAGLLFYQSTAYHRMLDKSKCLPAIAKLLENENQIPRRFATLAKLMQADLTPLKTDSLDEISRLMSEVRRRLDLSRAGTRVRKQEDEILAKLDKLIKKLEEQQQQQQSGGGNTQPSNPAQDSVPMGGTGPGNVDPKQIGSKSGWGNLPPKERQEALQQIGKDLPTHYREVIEAYFRKLAREGGN